MKRLKCENRQGIIGFLYHYARSGGGEIDLAHIFALITCFKDLAQASSVCRKWRQGVNESLARRDKLSFLDGRWTMIRQLASFALLTVSRSSTFRGVDGAAKLRTMGCTNYQLLSALPTYLQYLYGVLQESQTEVSRATSLQHLNIGGAFVTDASFFVIADSCPTLKTIVLCGCRHVTENDLLVLVNKCCRLESINVRGMRVPVDCFIGLLAINPALQIVPKGMPNVESVAIWPVY